MAAQPGDLIIRAKAIVELERLVSVQAAAFTAQQQQQQIIALNTETRSLVDQVRDEVQDALVSNKATADKQVVILRSNADSKLKTIEDMIQSHDIFQFESASIIGHQVEQLDRMKADMDTLVVQLRSFASQAESRIVATVS